MEGRTDGRTDGWTEGWMGGWVDGWMGGWVDGWMGGWVEGWMDGLTVRCGRSLPSLPAFSGNFRNRHRPPLGYLEQHGT